MCVNFGEKSVMSTFSVMLLWCHYHNYVPAHRTGWKIRPRHKTVILIIKTNQMILSACNNLSKFITEMMYGSIFFFFLIQYTNTFVHLQFLYRFKVHAFGIDYGAFFEILKVYGLDALFKKKKKKKKKKENKSISSLIY